MTLRVTQSQGSYQGLGEGRRWVCSETWWITLEKHGTLKLLFGMVEKRDGTPWFPWITSKPNALLHWVIVFDFKSFVYTNMHLHFMIASNSWLISFHLKWYTYIPPNELEQLTKNLFMLLCPFKIDISLHYHCLRLFYKFINPTITNFLQCKINQNGLLYVKINK